MYSCFYGGRIEAARRKCDDLAIYDLCMRITELLMFGAASLACHSYSRSLGPVRKQRGLHCLTKMDVWDVGYFAFFFPGDSLRSSILRLHPTFFAAIIIILPFSAPRLIKLCMNFLDCVVMGTINSHSEKRYVTPSIPSPRFISPYA